MNADFEQATDYLSSEGADFARRLCERRQQRADKLRTLRREISAEVFTPGTMKYRNQTIRHIVAFNYPPELRATREALLTEAARLAREASGPLPGAPGCGGTYTMDDGYSLCGLADSHAAWKEQAARDSLLLTAAARWI